MSDAEQTRNLQNDLAAQERAKVLVQTQRHPGSPGTRDGWLADG